MSASRLKLDADKTKLLWVGSKRGCSQLGGHLHILQLAADTQRPCLSARSDYFVALQSRTTRSVVAMPRTLSVITRQLRRVGRSLDVESAATLVRAFVSGRIDYCNAVLAAAAPKVTTRARFVKFLVPGSDSEVDDKGDEGIVVLC